MGILRISKHLKYSRFSHILQSQHFSASQLLSISCNVYKPNIRYVSWGSIYTTISLSSPVLTLQNLLIDIHNYSGLPWWSVIMLTTLGIRTFIVFPLAWHQNQVVARYANINSELGALIPELNKEVNIARRQYNWDETTARKVFKKNVFQYYKKFVVRDNCHPFKIPVLALFQIPIWICFSVSLRNLTHFSGASYQGAVLLNDEFKFEGALWFTDLTVPDPFFIPFLLGVVNLLLIEISSLRNFGRESKYQKIIVFVMRSVVILVATASAFNPSSVSFYWLCSSTFGLMQNTLLMVPRLRRILRIPKTKNDSATPFKDIALNFHKKFMS